MMDAVDQLKWSHVDLYLDYQLMSVDSPPHLPVVADVHATPIFGSGGERASNFHHLPLRNNPVHEEQTGFTFREVNSVRASASKLLCCHFSSDGKLLASGGHDKKAVLWYTDTLKPKTTLEEHSSSITDVRFSPSMPRLATSSFDKTVRVWDAGSPGYSLRTFTGHSASVMSVDFYPNKDDLICSCDGDGEIRYWSISNGSCAKVLKGGTTQMRFQPHLGRYLAAAAGTLVSILDVETQTCRHSLQGHTKPIHSVCWDPSGEYLASVSEDSVRVWTLGTGGEGECVHELSCDGNKFHSCAFHPTYSSLLVIGCYQYAGERTIAGYRAADAKIGLNNSGVPAVLFGGVGLFLSVIPISSDRRN